MKVPFTLDVVALFPGAVVAVLREGPVGRALRRGLVRLAVWQLREFSRDPHRKVDDVPFGGGSGMVLTPEPVVLAVQHALAARQDGAGSGERPAVLVLSAAGERLDQAMARELAQGPGLVLVCGRYEGIDARVVPALGAREVSVGDYVLSGGELAAAAVADAVVRLLPGAVGDPASPVEESFGPPQALTGGLLEYPHYTRPREFRGLAVPEVLLGGDHRAVARWRRLEALRRTWERRPELLAGAPLSDEERERVRRWQSGLPGPGGSC